MNKKICVYVAALAMYMGSTVCMQPARDVNFYKESYLNTFKKIQLRDTRLSLADWADRQLNFAQSPEQKQALQEIIKNPQPTATAPQQISSTANTTQTSKAVPPIKRIPGAGVMPTPPLSPLPSPRKIVSKSEVPDTGIFIKLKSEGDAITQINENTFEMPLSCAKLSGNIQNVMEDLGEQAVMGEGMPYANIDPTVFSQFIPLWNIIAQTTTNVAGMEEEEKLEIHIAALKTILQQYNIGLLYKLGEIANFLDIKSLLHATCSMCASKITSLNDIQKILSWDFIPHDISDIIAHYIFQNHQILEKMIKNKKGRGNFQRIAKDFSLLKTNPFYNMCINNSADIALSVTRDTATSLYIKRNNNDTFKSLYSCPNISHVFPCALSSDGRTIASMCKKSDGTIALLITNENDKTSEVDVLSYKDTTPLFATFSADDKKLCIAYADGIIIYETSSLKDKPKNSQPILINFNLPIQSFFAHIYEGISYLIIKPQDNQKYLMLDLNTVKIEENNTWQNATWEHRTALETFDFNYILHSGYKDVNNLIKTLTNIDRSTYLQLLKSGDAFNFYTYQLCTFVPARTYENDNYSYMQTDIILINLVSPLLKNLINLWNQKKPSIIDTLYLLACTFNDGKSSDVIENIFKKNNIAKDQTINENIKKYIKSPYVPEKNLTSVRYKTIISTHMKYFAYISALGLMVSGLTGIVSSISSLLPLGQGSVSGLTGIANNSLPPLGQGSVMEDMLKTGGALMIAGSAATIFTNPTLSENKSYFPWKKQYADTILNVLRIGLTTAIGFGMLLYASKHSTPYVYRSPYTFKY